MSRLLNQIKARPAIKEEVKDEPKLGDLNGDGVVDGKDLSIAHKAYHQDQKAAVAEVAGNEVALDVADEADVQDKKSKKAKKKGLFNRKTVTD